MTDDDLRPEQRRAMLELLEKSALTDYPNRERIGCPGDGFLETLARDRKSIPLSDPRLNHVARCSPCFGEFVHYRDLARRQLFSRRAAISMGTVAAAAVIGFAVKSTVGGGRFRYEHAEIDLLASGAQRGSDPNAVTAKVDLPRKPLDLAITLPFASPTGQYEIQILHREGTPTGLKVSGDAKRSGGKTILNVRIDLSSLPADDYQLGYRHLPFDTIPVPIKVR